MNPAYEKLIGADWMQSNRRQASHYSNTSFYFEQRVRDGFRIHSEVESHPYGRELRNFTGWTGTAVMRTLSMTPATVSLERR